MLAVRSEGKVRNVPEPPDLTVGPHARFARKELAAKVRVEGAVGNGRIPATGLRQSRRARRTHRHRGFAMKPVALRVESVVLSPERHALKKMEKRATKCFTIPES